MANRYLMWTLSTFVVALLLFTLISFRWILILSAIFLLALIPAAILKYSFKKLLFPCMVSFIVAAVFFSWSDLKMSEIQSELIDSETEITGEITDIGTNAAGNLVRYKVCLRSFGENSVSKYDRVYINLYCDADEVHLPGSVVEGKLSFFESPVDYGAGREDRILLSAIQEQDLLKFSEPQEGVVESLYGLRVRFQDHISFGNDKTQALLRSVCFGDTDSLDSALNVSLRRIGLTHVTSVSGLHLTFTVLLFNFLLIAVGLHYRVRYVLDIFIAIIFTILVGFPLSCVRACVMVVLMCLAMAFDLFDDGLTSLSVAAFLITVVNPFAIRDVGFLLSVTATAGIILMRLPIENFLFPKRVGSNTFVNWIYRKLTGAFSCSIAATVATLPIMVLVFGSISLIGPFANVLLIYPLEWVFMMGILMVLLGWIPGIGVALGWLCDVLYVIIEYLSGLLGRIPFASVSSFSLTGVVALVLFAGILAVAIYDFYVKKRRSMMLLFSLLLCFIGCFTLIYEFTHPASTVEVAFIDVGQGDCTVISRDHTAVIIDYGGSSQKRYNLIDYLKKKNIYNVELLAFTHLHSDHTNGLRSLLQNAYVDRVIYPELEFESDEQMELIYTENATSICDDLQLTVLDNVRINVMADAVRNEENMTGNERCVCYKISYGDTSVLVTGDLTGEAELLLSEDLGDTTLLKVSHHGSDTSSLYPFLKAADAEISVVSVGENSYGLPDDAVIERLKTISPEVYQTNLDGTLVFSTDGIKMERIRK